MEREKHGPLTAAADQGFGMPRFSKSARANRRVKRSAIPRPTTSVSEQCQPKARNGSTRSLFTHIAEPPTTINVNHIRSKRQVVKGIRANTTEITGGRCYSTRALVDNWVEERRDPRFRQHINPTNPKHARRMFLSTQTCAWNEALEEYREKLRNIKTVSKQTPGSDYRSVHSKNKQPELLFYSGGSTSFGGHVTCPDQTADYAKGGYWIGTAPVNMYETVGHVYGLEVPPANVRAGSSKLEFQKRAMWASPKDRVLSTMREVPDHLMSRALDRHKSSNKFSASWRSIHQSDYTNYIGHRAAPQLSDDLRSTKLDWSPGTSLVVGDQLPMRTSCGLRK